MHDDVRLIIITKGHIDEAWLDASVAVQLRDRDADDDALRSIATELRKVTAARGSMLYVNRRIALARDVSADGLHVDVDALRETVFSWKSAPCHDDDDVRKARDGGAHAVYVSPIFDTPEKGPACGLSAIERARAIAPDLRVIALGGINAENASACANAGAHAVAVIRAASEARRIVAAMTLI